MGRTKAELDQVIESLTGFDESTLRDHANDIYFEARAARQWVDETRPSDRGARL